MKEEKKQKKEKVVKENKKVKNSEKQVHENIRSLEKEILKKKELPNEELNKINKKVFENILIADIIMAFLYFVSLGSLNIESQIFIVDLKVFSIAFVVLAIILFEISYKKENGNICIHGIETLVLAIFTMLCISIYTIYLKEFHLYVATFSFLCGIYYVGKSIVIQQKMKKKYFASLNDIDEIIKK